MLIALLLATVLRGPADVETLTGAADAVVHARVTGKSAAWSADGGRIFTRVVLGVVETWKGKPAGEVTVVVPGGVADGLAQDVQGTPAFSEGEEVVVFLSRKGGGMFEVTRWALGKFAVGSARAAAPKRAVRDRSGLSCQGCGADEADDLGLDELRARVLRSSQQ